MKPIPVKAADSGILNMSDPPIISIQIAIRKKAMKNYSFRGSLSHVQGRIRQHKRYENA
jgi:hypothetical protein